MRKNHIICRKFKKTPRNTRTNKKKVLFFFPTKIRTVTERRHAINVKTKSSSSLVREAHPPQHAAELYRDGVKPIRFIIAYTLRIVIKSSAYPIGTRGGL